MPAYGKKQLLFLMNRWLSTAGGIQTVNRELACAISSQSDAVECVAIVTTADARDQKHAATHGIKLIAGDVEDEWSSAVLSPEIATVRPNDVLAVVGHCHFSGTQAIDLRKRFFPNALSVQFVHTSPLDTESLKEYRHDSYVLEREKRMKMEIHIAQQANLVVCVGPRLWRYMKDQLAAKITTRPRVLRLDCGLKRLRDEREPPVHPTLLCLGRADSINVKGLDLFAMAAAHITQRWLEHPIMKKRPKPRFLIRGAKEDPEGLERRLVAISANTGAKADIKVCAIPPIWMNYLPIIEGRVYS